MLNKKLDSEFRERYAKVMRIPAEVHKWIVGGDAFIKFLMICLISGSRRRFNSNVFTEEKVGVGKTATIDAFARACGGRYRRIQFAADMLPGELVQVPKRLDDGSMEFQEGPIFANFILADEINRASEKTRSKLLEAMEEGQVTIDNETHILPRPFMVLASANPVDVEGVFRLGAAQSDRFMMKISMEEESEDEALEILDAHTSHEKEEIVPVITPEEVLDVRDFVWNETFLSEDLKRYIVRLVFRTRKIYDEEEKAYGASGKRPYIWLARGSKALAFLEKRSHVIQEDIDSLVHPVLRHRISLGYMSSPREADEKLEEILMEMHSREAQG